MNRVTILWALIGLVVILGALWLWAGTAQAPTTPSLSITAPAGGEAWQAGEVHTISWSAQGVPASDKISITIRRLPPPPLPQEGQEFDPIIATNLPNSGSYSWTIAPMYPSGTYVVGVSAYVSVPVTNPISAESKPFLLSHPTLSADLYPLYKNADWEAPVRESFTIGTTTYSGASILSAPSASTMDPASVFTPFERYYDTKLKALGYSVANDLAAGGHVGGETGYRKGASVLLVRFHIDYSVVSSSSPSACPCSVRLSLFSTTP